MIEQDRHCEVCGARVELIILADYEEGRPVFRQFCLDCAEKVDEVVASNSRITHTPRLGVPGMLIFAGLLAGAIVAVADYVGVGGASGFGWYQHAGLGIGLLTLLIGALLRVDVVLVFGTLAIAIAAFSDLLVLRYQPGFGWKQQVACLVSVLLVTAGVLLRRHLNRRLSAPEIT